MIYVNVPLMPQSVPSCLIGSIAEGEGTGKEGEREKGAGREVGFSIPCLWCPWQHFLQYDSRTHFSYILFYTFLSFFLNWLPSGFPISFIDWKDNEGMLAIGISRGLYQRMALRHREDSELQQC